METVISRVVLMNVLMFRNGNGGQKTNGNDVKKVGEKEEEVVLHVFLRCPTYCEAPTRSSAVAIVSKSFEGFVC